MFSTILACSVASITRINFPRSRDECGPSSEFVAAMAVEKLTKRHIKRHIRQSGDVACYAKTLLRSLLFFLFRLTRN